MKDISVVEWGVPQFELLITSDWSLYRKCQSLLALGWKTYIEGWAQDYGNSNIFLKPLFRGNLDPFVNNANLGAIAHTSNGT